MTNPSKSSSIAIQTAAVALPAAILAIFFISGTSALIDQIVWTRALYRIFGVTALAASTVLAAFMAGLALGSYFFGRLIDRGGSALRMYAGMELAIAIITPLTPWIFKSLQPVYSAMAASVGLDSQVALPVLRGLLCFAVLLPPTVLMGGTLPVLAKAFLKNQPGRVTALLYSINTWGAVFGCFLAGFILLGVLGETRSLLLASCGNLAAAIWAWTLAKKQGDSTPSDAKVVVPKVRVASTSWVVRAVLIASFVNGFAALAIEVLWGRTLGLLTDASVYAFTGIIGMFLVGIALGSRLAAPFADRVKSPLTWLGLIVGLMALVLVAALNAFMQVVPHQFLGGENAGTAFPNVWIPLRTMFMAAGMIAPLTILSGACFPFLVRVVVTSDGHEGRQLGTVYSINTIGGILGATLAGYLLLPMLADQGAFCVVALLYVGSATLCLAVARQVVAALLVAVVAGGATLLLLPIGGSLSLNLVSKYGKVFDHQESAAGTVSAYSQVPAPPPPFERRLLVNGTGMTVLCTDTKLMAHLPLMLHPDPKNMLVICFGMGTTFRSASLHDLPVTVVELQPRVPTLFPFFHPDAAKVLANPKNQIRVGDGRNYLLLSKEKFSAITIDPAPPMYSAGTVNLYTREFFELCRSHLDDQGIMSLWIPGSACTESDFRLIIKTFTTVFDDYSLWVGPNQFGWYLIGSAKPLVALPENVAVLSQNERIRLDISEYMPQLVLTPELVPAMYLSGKPGIDRYVQSESRVLTDDRPYTEFPLLSWIGYGPDLKEQWMHVKDSVAPLREPPPPTLFPRVPATSN